MRFWDSRVVVSIGLVPRAAAPAASELQAAAEPEATGGIGRWFSTNFDFKAAVAVVTLAAGGITAYVSNSNDKIAAAAERHQLQVQVSSLQAAIAQRDSRFDSTVVSRDEYQNMLQFMTLLQQQTQLCGHGVSPTFTPGRTTPGTDEAH